MSEVTKCPFGYGEYDEEPVLVEDEPFLTEEERWAAIEVPDAEPEQDDYKPSVSENIPDFQKLREALDPFTKLAAARIKANLMTDPEVKESIAQHDTYNVSYRPEFVIMPPGLFDEGTVAFPQTHEENNALFKAFEQRHLVNGTAAEQQKWGPVTTGDGGSIWGYNQLRDKVSVHITYAEPLELDPKEHARYEETYKEHIAKGTETHMLELWTYRNREVSKNSQKLGYDKKETRFDRTPGRFTEFVYTHIETGAPDFISVPSSIVMPVGAYGREFAEKLVRATAVAMEQAGHVVDAEAAEIAEKYDDVLGRRTARGGSERYKDYAKNLFRPEGAEHSPITEVTPKAILQEGILSVMQALALLTADKVPGYDDPDKLLDDIVDQGVIERFTRKLPMGYVGPLTLKGGYFPNPLRVEDDGSLTLSEPFTEHLRAERQPFIETALMWLAMKHDYADDPDFLKDFNEGELAIICPVASELGGLRDISEAVRDLHKQS
jgi:hypothetical protein